MGNKPIVLADPFPQTLDRVFPGELRNELEQLVALRLPKNGRMSEVELDEQIPESFAVIGQSPLPAVRLASAHKLKAVFNIEGNFQPNIDYHECFRRGIRVLNCGGAYALPVAEMAIAMAIDLSRGITWEHQRFQVGSERYLSAGNGNSRLLSGSRVGIVGFGLLGRSLRRLLEPFRCDISVYDPWLPESIIKAERCTPASLAEILGRSEFIFILAGATKENSGFLGANDFKMISKEANVVLMSRASIVDFDELTRQVSAGSFRLATDVFPEEPLSEDHPIRRAPNVILSPHRAGGIPQAFRAIGEMVLDDLKQMLHGFAPVRMQAAEPELAARLMSKPARS